MAKPTGPQWLHLYRGISEVEPDHIDTSHVGEHWTTNPSVAESFATDGFDTGEPSGTVVEALIHRRHVIDPSSEEHRYWKEHHGVMSPDSPEQEKTIRTGALVHIQRFHHINKETGAKNTVEVPQRRSSRARA